MNGGGPPYRPVTRPMYLAPQAPIGMTGPPAQAPPPVPGQTWTAPGLATGDVMIGLREEAAAIEARRQAAAREYLARVQAGQSAALAQQQLAGGGFQQQQMAAGIRGPLAQRTAMYGQSRAAGDMLAQAAMARAQEEQAAQALLQQTYGAGAQQQLQAAQLQLQSYGIGQQMAAEREKRSQAGEAAEQEMLQQAIGGALGAAAAGAAMSDRRLKQGVRRPRTAAEQELLRALMEVHDA